MTSDRSQRASMPVLVGRRLLRWFDRSIATPTLARWAENQKSIAKDRWLNETAVLTQQLSNGLVLLGEHMPWLRSSAFTFLVPAGTCYEPAHLSGLASLSCEMSQRGCGPYDSRQYLEELDFLGVETHQFDHQSSHVIQLCDA